MRKRRRKVRYTTNWDRLKKENDALSDNILTEIYEWRYDMEKVASESMRVAEIAKYSDVLIDNIDEQFEKATKLKGIDVNFLFLATALQCVRQYVIGTITQRVEDQTAAKRVPGHKKTSSDRSHRYYNPSLEEIQRNPVPFDANIGAGGALSGGGKLGHRATALGHDPILGLIFGTSNIATSTLTNASFQSFHIATNANHRDYFRNRASTMRVLQATGEKLVRRDIKEGKIIVAYSLFREIEHLSSDIYSKRSLPLPIVSAFDPKVASKLAEYGLDMGNVVKVGMQAEFAVLINSIIGMLHGLYYDESIEYSWDVYSVRTRKILSYSNLIASASNVIAVAIASIIGVNTGNPDLVKKSVNYLDIGGVMVTIYRVVTDRNFIFEVKKEFLEHEWETLIME